MCLNPRLAINWEKSEKPLKIFEPFDDIFNMYCRKINVSVV